MLKELTDANVDQLLQSDRTFIIVFYSDQISNIDHVMSIFEDYDARFNGKIDVYSCDADSGQKKIASYFNMNVLPGVVMMKYNKAYVNVAGPVSASVYEDSIKKGMMEIMAEGKKAAQFAAQSGYKTL